MFSIKRLNYIFLSFMLINTLFYYFVIFFVEDTYTSLLLWLFTNFFLFFSFIFFNFNYFKDLREWKNIIRELIKDFWNNDFKTDRELLLKKLRYKETNDIYKLFKSAYVRKNIILKDYNDLQQLFFKLVPAKLLSDVGEKWKDRLSLWSSVKKNLIIVFIDIVWFSHISEKLSADKSLMLLNMYFDWIVEIIKANWWYIDKFLWDWVMIIFDSEKWDSAIKASVEIQDFLKSLKISDVWKNLSVWIWLNFWQVIVWTIWSKNRMEVTVVWDTVNTASKIETITREYDWYNILFSENLYSIIDNKESFDITKIWSRKLKWKEKDITLYWIKC